MMVIWWSCDYHVMVCTWCTWDGKFNTLYLCVSGSDSKVEGGRRQSQCCGEHHGHHRGAGPGGRTRHEGLCGRPLPLHHGHATGLHIALQEGGGPLDLWTARGEHRVGWHGYLVLAFGGACLCFFIVVENMWNCCWEHVTLLSRTCDIVVENMWHCCRTVTLLSRTCDIVVEHVTLLSREHVTLLKTCDVENMWHCCIHIYLLEK